MQAIVSGGTFVRSYALETGEVLWKLSGLTQAPIPTPVPGFGMVFLASGTNGQVFKAVKLGGVGDLTGSSAEVWTIAKGVPYNPTPLLWGDELYMIKEGVCAAPPSCRPSTHARARSTTSMLDCPSRG